MVENLIIHIGCHKAGSTWLQADVFPKIKDLDAITFYKENPIENEINYMQTCGEPYYEKLLIEQNVVNYLNGKKNVIISSEGFSGAGNTTLLGMGHQVRPICKRILDMFGRCQILIVIRNQRSALFSLYRDDIKLGYVMTFKNWIEARDSCFALNYFKYSGLIKTYLENFGKDNVKVILFEELFEKKTIDSILNGYGLRHLGTDDIDYKKKYNIGYGPLSLTTSRIINRLLNTKLNKGLGLGRHVNLRTYNYWRYNLSRRIDKLNSVFKLKKFSKSFDGYESILKRLYHDDNNRVSKLISKNLIDYEYA